MPFDAMLALVASRAGVHPVVYLHTRTDRVLAADMSAWVQSWSVPARLLMGASKGTGRPGRGGGGGGGGDRWSWVRERRNSVGRPYDRRQIIEMDKLDPPGDPKLIEKAKRRPAAAQGEVASGLARAFARPRMRRGG